MEEIKLFGHTIVLSASGFGSIDPWTLDYAKEHNIALMGTSEFVYFVLIDGQHIYRIRNEFRFCNELESPEITSWDDVLKTLDKYIIDYCGTLEESIKRLNKM